MEQTLILLKPDCLRRRLTGDFIRELLKWRHSKLEILALKQIHLRRGKAESLYIDHKGSDYFAKLIDFMISGPSVAMTVEGTLAQKEGRDYVLFMRKKWFDETKPKRENLVHASDSLDNAVRELKVLFE